MSLTQNGWNALSAGLSAGGGLFSGIANIISQGMANKANMKAVQANNDLQRELAEYQWSKNLEMWNLQNEFNSPAAQMQRFKAAGLNPNLIYGQGNPGNASSLPSYQSPNTQPVTRNAIKFSNFNMALDLLAKYQQVRIGQQQERNMETQQWLTQLDGLMRADRNTRDWQLHPYNLDIKRAILQSTLNSAEKLAWESGIKGYEYKWWRDYGYSPNIGYKNVLFNKLLGLIQSWFKGSRRTGESIIKTDLSHYKQFAN